MSGVDARWEVRKAQGEIREGWDVIPPNGYIADPWWGMSVRIDGTVCIPFGTFDTAARIAHELSSEDRT